MFCTFFKKVSPPELNFAEKILDRDFSKLRQTFSKWLNLSNGIWLKLIWFKYELLTPTESKIRASRACHLLFVQGVLFYHCLVLARRAIFLSFLHSFGTFSCCFPKGNRSKPYQKRPKISRLRRADLSVTPPLVRKCRLTRAP